jgi:hypothetical protein
VYETPVCEVSCRPRFTRAAPSAGSLVVLFWFTTDYLKGRAGLCYCTLSMLEVTFFSKQNNV